MKFKYEPFQIPIEWYLDEKIEEIECPLIYKNLPNGIYLIRGNKKGYRKKYYNLNGSWRLVEDIIKDNGHYYCDSTIYLLFPSLPEKEWKKIKAVGWKRLNKVWQRHLFGYEQWKEIQKSKRNMALWHLKNQ